MMRLTWVVLALALCATAQDREAKQRAKAARDLAKGGSENIAQLTPMLKDPDAAVRAEAVRSIVTIGTQHSLDPLLAATRDNDPEVQLRATDGLVNFYHPGYVQTGMAARLTSSVRGRFERENREVIDPFVTVRPEVVDALGKLARGGGAMEVRANAARAVGILRGRAAVEDLVTALRTKDDNVIFESLIALQKIGDQSAGPRVVFLVRDLHERVQIAAIETVGLLKAKEGVPQLASVFGSAKSDKVRSAALTALAMLADPSSKPVFERAFNDKSDQVRASAAEGFARLKDASERPRMEKAFADEKRMPPRLAQAFALVSMGSRGTEEFAPLTYLVNTLNSRAWRDVARPYLTELARDAEVRTALHGYLGRGMKDEKLGILRVLAASGDKGSVAAVEPVTKDPDPEVAQEAIRTLRTLQARTQ